MAYVIHEKNGGKPDLVYELRSDAVAMLPAVRWEDDPEAPGDLLGWLPSDQPAEPDYRIRRVLTGGAMRSGAVNLNPEAAMVAPRIDGPDGLARLQAQLNANAQIVVRQVNAEMRGRPAGEVLQVLCDRMRAMGVIPEDKGLIPFADSISAGSLRE